MSKEKDKLIQNFNKISFNNICFGNKKKKDGVQIIDIKYKQDKNKIPFYFKTSSIKLISNYKHNVIRGEYIEGLINDADFYKFILSLEDYVKHLLIKNYDKTLSGEMLDELFKTNIRLDRHFNDPILRLNIITNTKNKNTKMYDYNKNTTEFNSLEKDKSINCIVYFKQIFIYDNMYEFDLIIEEIRFN